jgi:hypothetical protein
MVFFENHLEKAKKIASKSDVLRAKLSAIAFSKRGHVISFAHNRTVYGRWNKWTEHAEEVLIKKLNKLKAFDRYDDITMLVFRFNTQGIKMAKPCAKCCKIIKKYNISVFYTTDNGILEHLR